MKTLKIMALVMCSLLISCENNPPTKKALDNQGTTIVKNGRDVNDTVTYKCVGCSENLSTELFDQLVQENTIKAKNNLVNPLSFEPLSMDIVVMKLDSLYDFETNKKIDSVVNVLTTYKYIGKNAYGTEQSVEQVIEVTFVNGVMKDLSNEIKLPNLKFDGKYINRTLSLYSKSSYIEIIPTKDKNIIVKSSTSCVDEGTWFLIELDNGEELKLVSWNDFNCEGNSYFYWFSKSQIEKLKSRRITTISVVDKNSISIVVPKNKSDYFQQLLSLY
jgi:hypothetical protein